jgi:uncharacterized linocin/CFP29 family protein
MTDLLRRDMAPITDGAWQEIDRQSLRILKGHLSGRSLVDFSGPHGWDCAAVNVGRLDVPTDQTLDGVTWGMRKVQPLVELRVPFRLGIWELDDIERGARNPNLDALTAAARKVAMFEETAIYLGFKGAGIRGLLAGSSHAPVALGPDRAGLPESVEAAVFALQEAGIGGPYALVLGTEPYRWLMAGTPNGYPLHKQILAMVTGGIHWSPALRGGAVVSRRGGDFTLTVGQDLAIGYKGHNDREVELYFTESFTFRAQEPAAAVALEPREAARKARPAK